MNFGEFCDILSHVRRETYIDYIKSLDEDLRDEAVVNIANHFPLPKSPDPSLVRQMATRYNLYTNVLSMKLGQFILLESAINSDEPEYKISSLIIRPLDELSFDNDDIRREDEILQSIIEEDFSGVYSVIQTMLLNREYILFTKFSGVIYDKIQPVDNEDEEEYEPDDESNHNSQWFWYKVVRTLANEDITMYPKIYELKMSDVMVELSYRAQVSIIENAKARAEEARTRALYRR